jgi:hypothetical protein
VTAVGDTRLKVSALTASVFQQFDWRARVRADHADEREQPRDRDDAERSVLTRGFEDHHG